MSSCSPTDRRRVAVTGVGVITPLGDTPVLLSAALRSGRTGIAPVELFEPDGMKCRQAFEVRGFNARQYLGDGNLRPLDRSAQLVAAAAHLALGASGWTTERRQQQEVGLVLGTMFGSVHTISAFDRRALTDGPIYAKPMDFANSVINAAAGQTAIWHGLRGVNSTVSGGTTSGLQALAYASDLIRTGKAETVLAGGGEELCFESYYGFYRAGLVAGSHNGHGPLAVPFDARRNGFIPGEGAALLMLEEMSAARRRGASILAEVHGWGMGYDASRGRDGERATGAMRRAICDALEDSDTAAQTIAAVSSSASGSIEGDRNEALGIAAALGREVPVTAVKSMLGEAFGASGALQAVALMQTMVSGVLPGVRGFERADDAIPSAMVSGCNRELDLDHGLVTAVGLDGNTCALVLGNGRNGTCQKTEEA